jgi:hypothetical protein
MRLVALAPLLAALASVQTVLGATGYTHDSAKLERRNKFKSTNPQVTVQGSTCTVEVSVASDRRVSEPPSTSSSL